MDKNNTPQVVEQVESPFQMTPEIRSAMGVDALTPSEDQKIPRLRLIQSSSRMEGTPGHFHNSITGLVSEFIEAVVLRVQKGRVYWPEKYQADQDPLCASDTWLTPRAGFENRYDHGQGCLICPMGQWDKTTPPACSQVYNYLLVEIASRMPVLISILRTSTTTAKQLNTMLSIYGCSHQFKFYSEQVSDERGRWFEWRVSDGGKIANWADYLQMATLLSKDKITTDTESTVKASPVDGTEKKADLPF